MQSLFFSQEFKLKETLLPWEQFNWSPAMEQCIYRDWGDFYTHRNRLNYAKLYYDRSLALKPDDYKTLLKRSKLERITAKIEDAMDDCLEAKEISQDLHKQPTAAINLEECQCLYELNQFERCKQKLSDNLRLYKNKAVKNIFLKLNNMVDDAISDATDYFSVEYFLLKHPEAVAAVKRDWEKQLDTRLLWKIRRDEGKCDVRSILELEKPILSPMERARRDLAYNVYNQYYLKTTWQDVRFFKQLRNNRTMMLKQSKRVTPYLRGLIDKALPKINKFSKMLETREPLFTKRLRAYSSYEMLEQNKEKILQIKQYRARREAYIILRKIRELREAKNCRALASYIEQKMGNFTDITTNRILPWKFIFTNEVYNTLALALVAQYRVPVGTFIDSNNIYDLLQLKHEKHEKLEKQAKVFGGRSTYVDPSYVAPAIIRAQNLVKRLVKRFMFAKYSIEKCYINHQLGDASLQQNLYEECCTYAKRTIEESDRCNSNIYRFLGNLLLVKANIVSHKNKYVADALVDSLEAAIKLKSLEMVDFISALIDYNDECLLQARYMNTSEDSIQSRSKPSSFTNFSSKSSIIEEEESVIG